MENVGDIAKGIKKSIQEAEEKKQQNLRQLILGLSKLEEVKKNHGLSLNYTQPYLIDDIPKLLKKAYGIDFDFGMVKKCLDGLCEEKIVKYNWDYERGPGGHTYALPIPPEKPRTPEELGEIAKRAEKFTGARVHPDLLKVMELVFEKKGDRIDEETITKVVNVYEAAKNVREHSD